MKALILLLAPLAACTIAAPDAPVSPHTGTVTYTCSGGRVLPVTYGQEADFSNSVKISPDGQKLTLLEEPIDGGRRFAWPSDGSNYVWEVRGVIGTLLWHDGTTNAETPRLTDCKPA